MTILSTDAVTIITNQLTALSEKRASLLQQVAEIDSKVAGIARQLGVELPKGGEVRLPLPSTSEQTPQNVPEAMMQVLANADRGYTRSELKQILRDGPVGASVRRNENTYYNAVKRYLDNLKIVEVHGYLYHPARAPLDGGEADPTGQHLPSNVSSLFAEREGA